MHFINRLTQISGLHLIFIFGLVWVAAPADAGEYRKCNYKFMVKGEGLSPTEVEGARFWAWGRARFASQTWRRLHLRARSCAVAMLNQDYAQLPSVCYPNDGVQKNRDRFGTGITGLNTTQVRSRLKQTICTNHRRPEQIASIADTRTIDGFVVYIRPVSGTGGACDQQSLMPVSTLTIHCRRDGTDSELEWFHQRN